MDPIKDNKAKYLFYKSSPPFNISTGKLKLVEYVDDAGIVAHFKVSNKSEDYDEENDRVYVSIFDSNKHPLMEGWVPMNGLVEREGRLWLREKI